MQRLSAAMLPASYAVKKKETDILEVENRLKNRERF